MIRRRHTAALAAVAVLALATTGTTYAAFADSATIDGNQVGAGTLVVDPLAVEEHLRLADRGTQDSGTLTVGNAGTTAYELRVVVEETSSPLCLDGDTDLVMTLASTDLCDLLGDPEGVVVSPDVAPGADAVHIELTAALAENALYAWAGRSGVFHLDIQGRQSGSGQGFSDFAKGLLTVTIDDFAPDVDVPAECPHDLGDFRIIRELGTGRHELDLSDQLGPALVTAGQGTKDIVGTAEGDCIIVGNGNNTVSGGSGDDTIVAGKSDAAGTGKAVLHGDAGDDVLMASNGKVTLNGGPGTDHCVADAQNADTPSCESGSDELRTQMMAPTSTTELSSTPPGTATPGDPPKSVTITSADKAATPDEKPSSFETLPVEPTIEPTTELTTTPTASTSTGELEQATAGESGTESLPSDAAPESAPALGG